MNEAHDDEAVDTWLRSALVAEPVVDEGPFTAAVLERIDRAATGRRALLAIGYVAAAVIAFVSISEPWVVSASVTPAVLAGTMTLSALCSVVWMATLDSPRTPSAMVPSKTPGVPPHG